MTSHALTFPGLTDYFTGNATVTLSHGTKPSQFDIEVESLPAGLPQVGTLELLRDGAPVVTFPSCAVNGVYRSIELEQRFHVKILDRRWKWDAAGVISGWYNERLPDGSIRTGTEKTPQELLTILFTALGDSSADVSAVPDFADPETVPEIRWDNERPVEALDELLSEFNVRCILKTDNTIMVARAGNGADLPEAAMMSDGTGLEDGALPDSIMLVSGPTIWQGLLKLQAVGLDTDGKWKPIDDLSFKPADGWEKWAPQWPDRAIELPSATEEELEDARRLAAQHVWRTYKVLGQHDGEFGPVTGFTGELTHIGQYLPLLTELVDSETNADGTTSYLAPYVRGRKYDESIGEHTEETTRLGESFTIDAENGMITFERAVYAVDESFDTQQPDLWLYTAFNLRHANTGAYTRTTVEEEVPNRDNGTGSQPFRVDDLSRIIKLVQEWEDTTDAWQETATEDNETAVDDAADYYIAARLAELQPGLSIDRPYAGWINISPDGAIQQVSWTMQEGGGDAVAQTRASRNSEHSIVVQKYPRRLREALVVRSASAQRGRDIR